MRISLFCLKNGAVISAGAQALRVDGPWAGEKH